MSNSNAPVRKKSKTKKAAELRRINTRRGVVLIALLAVMIFVVNLIVSSYSWFTTETETGVGLALDMKSSIRSERCIFETYQGTLVTADNWETGDNYKAQGYYIDQVAYNNTKIADDAVITIPKATTKTENGETVIVPGRVYFRTNIQNLDTEHPSVISLYHHQMLRDVGVAITYPSNTYHRTEDVYDDYFILRNAYVKVRDDNDVDGPGLLPVEWFVENFDTSATKSIRVTRQNTGVESPIEWLYLMYN